MVVAVDGKIPVFFDGGLRRGTDVFKALALGAKAVMVAHSIPKLFEVNITIVFIHFVNSSSCLIQYLHLYIYGADWKTCYIWAGSEG